MTTRSGTVTLAGRPNVGKSTLLNRLVGQKISITSSRAQTTRHRLLGIKTTEHAQIVYVDTPGLHTDNKGVMNRYMNRVATASLQDVDCVVLMIAASGWSRADEFPLKLAISPGIPVILAINKIDQLKDRARLLPLMETSSRKAGFAEIVPVSARTGANADDLEKAILKHLPEQPFLYPADQLSDRGERFHAAELIREQIFRGFRQEIPYVSAVKIEQFRRTKGALNIEATIWVEKEGQKPILIGKDGQNLKNIGSRARLAMQKQFGAKVHLHLWVKVRKGWSDSDSALRSLGYADGE
ncbi:MAG: GTPase Era [Gammaproteobacteria bacterium]|nr:GTPase Era [Gammaproteobacteria bacterium]MDH3405821.1 GTPase Era [Gammaproteobacteria bacterium]MDH5486545.1 GTPase Era [Gammaproteobacteria bacterium]